MNIKQRLTTLFTYTPANNYEFDLPQKRANPENTVELDNKGKQNIYSDIKSNLEHIKISYNTLINSDIVIREFTLNAKGRQFDAILLYIDGMIDSNTMNDFILKPLMLRNTNNLFNGKQEKVLSQSVSNNVIIRKVEKFNLAKYLLDSLIPQNSVKQIDTFDMVFNSVNSGNCVLFIDTLNVGFDIEVKGFKQRSVESPNNEVVIKGSQEAFVENIRTNTSILRRIINNENLIIENLEVGKITKTKCGVCYMQNIANSDLVAEAKFRLNNLAIDSLLSSR